jgi:hypothetical protein
MFSMLSSAGLFVLILMGRVFARASSLRLDAEK